MSAKHELKQIGNRLRILSYLFFGIWIEDRKACVDVPFLGVDAERQVNLDILNTADIASNLPGKLRISMPRFAHTKECCMCDCLGISSDAIMLGCGKMDML